MNDAISLGANRQPDPLFDEELLAEVSAALDLRRPNELAVQTIAQRLAAHAGTARGFVGVVDVATGVGKTYVVAGTLEYLARQGLRDFAVITPGRTILDKTVGNFTRGGRKSLVGNLTFEPVVITSDNFGTPSMRSAMDDPDRVKLYVFTVQALVRPTSNVSRRTHAFTEGLGKAFYEHLAELERLVVFADEHHTYFGAAFSRAIGDLRPYAVIGLTATPHRDTPAEQIIFRYPLANTIADQLVKTPVLVGRTDDRSDDETKLRDGVTLLDAKQAAISRWAAAEHQRAVNPVMLVVCESIDHAKDVEALIAAPQFFGGRFRDSVLRVDSTQPDAALAALETVEEPDSPVRIIVSVGMLKEGWDVANVFVICSLRASVSEILTEQTLGRGLRLPYGAHTQVEMIDTLEVLAHERYEDLLRRTRALREELVDWRTVPDPTRPDIEEPPAPRERPPTQLPLVAPITGGGERDPASARPDLRLVQPPGPGAAAIGGLNVTDRDKRVRHAEESANRAAGLMPRTEFRLEIPRLVMERPSTTFSLADVTDVEPFRLLGRQLRLDPQDFLRRHLLSARVVTGPDGIPRAELETRRAQDPIYSQGVLLPPSEARRRLVQAIVLAPEVEPRASEARAAQPLVDAFLDGLGDAFDTLGAYLDRAAGGLQHLVAQARRRHARRPEHHEVVRVEPFTKVRSGRAVTSTDRFADFNKTVGYQGWQKAFYEENWFDSRPERDVANAADAAPSVEFWIRLLRGDLPILWNGMDSAWYNPDLIAVESDGTHWLIEVKSDRDLETTTVLEKREAAQRWAAKVTADTGTAWKYLLLGQSQIEGAHGSWAAMTRLYVGR